MRDYNDKRPDDIGCDNIWELYRITPQVRAIGFAHYLEGTDIWFVMDSDCGAPRITMIIPLPDSAVGCIESCIWFFKHEAEVRTYYPKPVSEICEESEHKGQLLRLLNFFNARVYPDQTDGGAGSAEPQLYFAPRFYITEDGGFDITATTFVNYQIWDTVYAIHDYIIHYCPEILSDLAPYVVCVLKGVLTAEEAIERIETGLMGIE